MKIIHFEYELYKFLPKRTELATIEIKQITVPTTLTLFQAPPFCL